MSGQAGEQLFLKQNGGVGVRIVLIVASLAVVAAAISWFLISGQSDEAVLNRKASEICEYGLLQALAHLKENPSWTGELPRTDYEGGWFSATAKSRKSGGSCFSILNRLGTSDPC